MDAPEAMALATATPDGAPSVRMVLLKGFDERGLVFFSHYTSRKGRELEANPQAALLFHWGPLGRQVRVEGRVERVAAEESDAYFATRPRGAQLGALASRQSEPLGVAGRAGGAARGGRERARRRPGAAAADVGRLPPRPAAWEFWQHRASRLHDRFRYEREPSRERRLERLFPRPSSR